MAAHHRVHDYACCHLQTDCLESGILTLDIYTSMGTFTFTLYSICFRKERHELGNDVSSAEALIYST